MSVEHISNKEELNGVITSGQPVLIDFWAPWCGPCKMVGPEVEAVATQYDGRARIVKINIDDNEKLAQEYNIMGVPTLLIMKDGQEINRVVGFRPRKDIGAALEKAL